MRDPENAFTDVPIQTLLQQAAQRLAELPAAQASALAEDLRALRRRVDDLLPEKPQAPFYEIMFENHFPWLLAYDWYPQTGQIHRSAGAGRVLGYTDDEIDPDPASDWWQARFHPEDGASFAAQFAQLLGDPNCHEYMLQYRLRHKDGHWVSLLDRGHIFRDARGQAVRVVGFNSEITQQRQVEDDLRAHTQHLRDVLNGLFTFVGVMTPDGVLIEANDPPLQAAGLGLEDVIGKRFENTFWWNYAVETQERIRAAIAQARAGNTTRFDIPVRMAGDQLMTIDLMIAPLRDAQGQVRYLVPSAVDVTARKQLEMDLRASEAGYRQLVELSPDTIYVQVNGCFVYMNPAGVRLLGADHADEILGRAVLDFIHPDDRARVAARIRRLKEDRQPVEVMEERFLRLDGSPVTVESIAGPFLFQNQPGALVILHDLSRRKADEARLAEAHEQLGLTLRGARLGVWTADLASGAVTADSLARQILGQPEHGNIASGEVFLARIHPEDRARLSAAFAEARQPGSVLDVDFRLLQPSGTARWVYCFGSVDLARGLIHGIVQDVTDRRTGEEALLRSEERLRLALSAAQQGVWDWDVVENVLVWDARCREVFGLPEDALPSYDWHVAHIHTDDVARVQQVSAQALAERREYVQEYRTIWPDGSLHWIATRGSGIYDASGKPRRMTGIVLEVTERKAREEDLRQRTEEMQALLDAMPALVWVAHDPQARSITGNRAANELVGLATGANISQSVVAEGLAPYLRQLKPDGTEYSVEELAIQRAIATREAVRNQEIEFRLAGERAAHVLGDAVPLFDENGQVRGAVGAFVNVSEWREAQRRLREQEARFRVALSAVPLLMYTCDREQRYTWIYNPMLGFREEDALGKRDDELLPPEAAAELIRAKQQVLDGGVGGIHEVCVPLNGVHTYYLLRIEPVREANGDISGLICAALDVTAQRELEAKQRAAQMNQEVQRHLNEYREKERQEIARDIHDGPIQTLAGTIFNIQFAKEIADAPMQVELEQIGLNIKTAVRELREVVNELRPPSLIRFGVAKALRMHAEDYREKHPEIAVDLDLYEDGSTLAENVCLALFRIVQEALQNVARHAAARQVWVRLTRSAQEVRLEVSDDGTGFAPPADMSGQTQRGHYGMAGMKERAEAIGARFRIESAPGEGTTVAVRVPLERALRK